MTERLPVTLPSGYLGHWLSRLVEPYVLFPVIAVLLLGVVWGTTLHLIKVERTTADRAAASSSLELVETYEAQVVRALRETDQTLKFVKFMRELEGRRIKLSDLDGRRLLPPNLLFVVSIADSEGNIVASTRPPEMKNIADQDYFRVQRDVDALSIGRPQLSADKKEWKLHFSRRLNTADGSFSGVVIVSVAADYFVSGYERSRLGDRGVLGVLGTDGVFRARRTGESVSSGDVTDYTAVVAGSSRVDALPEVTLNRWDGVRRYTSARELFDFPVAVVVGLSEDEQLAAVNRRASAYLWRAAGGSALLILFLAGLARMSWQLSQTRTRANRALQDEIAIRRHAEAALKLRNRAIESSVNAVLIANVSNPDYPIEYVNPAFERITGYRAAEAMGRDIGFLLGADRDQSGVDEIQTALREEREGHAVVRNYRKDGSLFWSDFYIAPVRDEKDSVTHYVGVMNDVTAAKTYEQRLTHQATVDALTGLANRNLLQDRLHQAIVNARRGGGTVTVVLIDLDNFKLVNDSLGHTLGDALLREIGARLKSCVRESDTVARLGGDEFVLLLLNAVSFDPALGTARKEGDVTSLESNVTVLMQRLLASISRPVVLGDREVRPTCSIGVSIHPQDGDGADTLLKNADAAMYRAKELGRNRYQFFTSDVHERIRRRTELESSLRLALEREEFELHYQPQVGLGNGRIAAVEALLRWRHPQKGLILPGEFIGFAEETGLIVPIGTWVLTRACAQNKSWQDAGLPHIPVAVNMSAKQCEQQDIDTIIKRSLRIGGLSPQYLHLEITESISMARPEQSVPLMARLKETGVTLCIDDFGTGFSNLSYLKRFPVDRLKIDRSFVGEIATDPSSLAISEAIITMSHSLNLEVVAEGVETKEQLALLRQRDCDLIQGNYFSPPVTADAFAQLLKKGRRLPIQGKKRHARSSIS